MKSLILYNSFFRIENRLIPAISMVGYSRLHITTMYITYGVA